MMANEIEFCQKEMNVELNCFFESARKLMGKGQYVQALDKSYEITKTLGDLEVDLVEAFCYEIINACIDDGRNVSQLFSYVLNQVEASHDDVLYGWVNLLAVFYRVDDDYLDTIIEEIVASVQRVASVSLQDEFYLLVAELLDECGEHKRLSAFLKFHKKVKCLEPFRIEDAIFSQRYKEVIRRIEALQKKEPDKVTADFEEFLKIAYFQTKQGVDYLRQLIEVEGDFSRYEELKALEPDIYPLLKKQLKGCSADVYHQLLLIEQDFKALIQLLQSTPRFIESDAPLLVERYPKEVASIYKSYVRELAQCADGKRKYLFVCEALKRMESYISEEEFRPFVKELQVLCKRKPRLVEALESVLVE